MIVGPVALAESARHVVDAVRSEVGLSADSISSVIIAGGPLTATARRIAALGVVPIIEPIPSACELVREAVGASRRV
ncbi:MAG: hypothetical protein ABIZ07_06690 [Dermatophilaceae bacterium]